MGLSTRGNQCTIKQEINPNHLSQLAITIIVYFHMEAKLMSQYFIPDNLDLYKAVSDRHCEKYHGLSNC